MSQSFFDPKSVSLLQDRGILTYVRSYIEFGAPQCLSKALAPDRSCRLPPQTKPGEIHNLTASRIDNMLGMSSVQFSVKITMVLTFCNFHNGTPERIVREATCEHCYEQRTLLYGDVYTLS